MEIKVPSKRQLQIRQGNRTKRAREQDARLKAETIVPVHHPRTRTWMKHPNSMDVRGIDTRSKAAIHKATRGTTTRKKTHKRKCWCGRTLHH